VRDLEDEEEEKRKIRLADSAICLTKIALSASRVLAAAILLFLDPNRDNEQCPEQDHRIITIVFLCS